MNILLLGKNGQVGHELRRTLLPLGHLTALGRADLNLEDVLAVRDCLHREQPNIIVNAAAYTAVDQAESDPHAALTINEKAVHVLADYAYKNKALLVHYSTDYVFDGEKKEPYLETDRVNPLNQYGASKHAGEQAIQHSGCDFLIFRTSWVFGAHGNNFIKTIVRLASEKENLRIVSDQYGAPTSAEFIADVTALALLSHQHHRLPNGIYHLTTAGSTTWYHFAYYLVERLWAHGATLQLHPKHIYPIATEAYPLPAKRPKNSLLNTELVSHTLGLCIPDWKVYVDRLIVHLTK